LTNLLVWIKSSSAKVLSGSIAIGILDHHGGLFKELVHLGAASLYRPSVGLLDL
jgi:hypothetical protein